MLGVVRAIMDLDLSLYEARVYGLISMEEYMACDAYMAVRIMDTEIVPFYFDVNKWASDAKKFIEAENWNEVQFVASALWGTLCESYKLGGKQSVDALFTVACGLIGREVDSVEIGMELYRARC